MSTNRELPSPLRLFVAIDLPDEVKALLAEIQSRLRAHTTALHLSDPSGTHLTLKFLGNVAAERVDAVAEALRLAAAASRPFALRTADLGVFPNPRRPRVVWLGVAGDLAELSRLKDAVEATIAPLGFPAEARPFSPHLTLGRSPKQPIGADLLAIAAAVGATEVPRVAHFGASEVVLMRSEPTPRGARYTPLAAARLDARA